MTVMTDSPALLWLRRELRLRDNPALAAAMARGRKVVPVFVLDDTAPGRWALGGAQRWWLHHSLAALAADLAEAGAPLVLRPGGTRGVLADLVRETGAAEVHAGYPVEPWARRLTDALAAELPVPLRLHKTQTLFGPEEIRTGSGGPYGAFSPFARACRARDGVPPPLPAPRRIPGVSGVRSESLDSWRLLPRRPDWAGGLRATWAENAVGEAPGEAGAQRRLHKFVRSGLQHYDRSRNFPGRDGVSMLSPRLHFGEISPGEAWHACERADPAAAGARAWTDELLWREFSAHLLWHHPELTEKPLRPAFAAMPWRHDPAALRAWQRGETGVPIVDAGMRQLWHGGWMHNRVRMLTASFLTKHLLLPWQDGAAWFWDTLVDADLASNSAQWQWVAGSGADAAPFFRIFNPALQGKKFDAEGGYVRAWVPELARMPDRFIHAPWEAPGLLLAEAGVRLGHTYPHPVVDLAHGRARALAAVQTLPGAAA
jgi:deoxyribodipyrimidine photo-lyase